MTKYTQNCTTPKPLQYKRKGEKMGKNEKVKIVIVNITHCKLPGGIPVTLWYRYTVCCGVPKSNHTCTCGTILETLAGIPYLF